MDTVSLSAPLELRSGAVLPNRIVKAAMEEQLADRVRRGRQLRSYRCWRRAQAPAVPSTASPR